MDMPEGLLAHQEDYRPNSWSTYTIEELEWWVKLLRKRATHRTDQIKRRKDLYDARNYKSILDAKMEEN